MNKNKFDGNLDTLKNGIFLATRGGGVRSCVSIGVIRALEEANIPIKEISGESLSSLITALHVSGYKAEEILELFLKHNKTITTAGKIFGGKGSVVIEEIVNYYTHDIKIKDVNKDFWINACTGTYNHPELIIFSKKMTPDVTLGEACRASASLPIVFGKSIQKIYDKEYTLFDGGLLINPYVPKTEYPIVYSSFHNTIDLNMLIPKFKKTIQPVMDVSDIIIDAPVGKIFIIGSNKDMIKAEKLGYEEAKKVLKL